MSERKNSAAKRPLRENVTPGAADSSRKRRTSSARRGTIEPSRETLSPSAAQALEAFVGGGGAGTPSGRRQTVEGSSLDQLERLIAGDALDEAARSAIRSSRGSDATASDARRLLGSLAPSEGGETVATEELRGLEHLVADATAPPPGRAERAAAAAASCAVAALGAANAALGLRGTGAAAYEELLATPPELLGGAGLLGDGGASPGRARTGLEFVSAATHVPPTLGHGRRSLPQEHQLLPSGAPPAPPEPSALDVVAAAEAALELERAALAPRSPPSLSPPPKGSAQLKSCLSSSKKRRPRTAASPGGVTFNAESRVTTFRGDDPPSALTPGGTERTREADGRRASDPGGAAAAAADAGGGEDRRKTLENSAALARWTIDHGGSRRPDLSSSPRRASGRFSRVEDDSTSSTSDDDDDDDRERAMELTGALTADFGRGAPNELSPIGEEGEAQSPESAPSTAAPKFGANFESPDGGDDAPAPDADRTVALEAHLGELLDLSPGAPPADATVQLEASLGELLEASGGAPARARASSSSSMVDDLDAPPRALLEALGLDDVALTLAASTGVPTLAGGGLGGAAPPRAAAAAAAREARACRAAAAAASRDAAAARERGLEALMAGGAAAAHALATAPGVARDVVAAAAADARAALAARAAAGRRALAADLRKAAKTLAAEADAVQDGAAALRDHEAKARGLDDAADRLRAAAVAAAEGRCRALVDRVAALERRRDELRAAPPGALVVAPPRDDADAKYREQLAAGLHGWTAAKVGADEAVLALPHALYGTWATFHVLQAKGDRRLLCRRGVGDAPADAALANVRAKFGAAPDDACASALFAAPHVWLHPAAHVVDSAVFEVAVAEAGGQKALVSELARAALGAAKLQRLGKELFALQATCAMAPPAWSSSACSVAVDARSVSVGATLRLNFAARRGYPAYGAGRLARPGPGALLTLAIEPGLGAAAPRLADRAIRALADRGLALPGAAGGALHCQHTPGSLLAVCACVQQAIDQDLPPPVAAEDAPAALLDRERPPQAPAAL